MKNIVSLLVLSFSSFLLYSQSCRENHQHAEKFNFYTTDTRSDSIDIINTDLYMDFHELDGFLEAHATIEFQALVNNIEKIDLDLLGFTVDSVLQNDNLLAFDYDTQLLEINLNNPLQTNENTSVTIYYHGNPTVDGSGFGGLDYTSSYAYNMGVGFLADPHPFGRSMFPCFDNFVERSTYDFHILTDSSNYAYCNGAFISRIEIGEDSLLTTWVMANTIPSYLASVGVSTYTHVEQMLPGIAGDIPAFLIAKPQDTTDMKSTFVNLPIAFSTYENRFGPYRWNKVGYNLVPNNGGAMEHATNIAFPKILADGSLTFQYIVAHELAHHWWGDLVTCSTQEDMWINEGMASYCEQLFFESLGGEVVYIDHVRDNHLNVFYNAHTNDGAWLPVSGIGTENTYGSTVYNKGSDVAHVLRSYLGDDDFFEILTNFLDDNQFSDVSSEEFRDYIIAAGTEANINAYFDNWIFNPGFPEFEIYSQAVEGNGNEYTIDLTINQQLYHAPQLYTDVPIVVRVMDDQQNFEDIQVVVSGASTAISVTSSLNPKVIYLNPKDKISQATLGDNFLLNDVGFDYFAYSDFRVRVNEINENDSYWFRSECHFGDPDPENSTADYILSDDRFWRVRMFGVLESEDNDIEGRIKFNGNENSSSFRDETFFEAFDNLDLTEDSLVIMYREFGDSPWSLYENFEVHTQGPNTNWVGNIDILDLKSGDYTWGYKNPSSSVPIENEVSQLIFQQSIDDVIISGLSSASYSFALYDSIGRIVATKEFVGKTRVKIADLANGNYLLKVKEDEKDFEEIFRFVVAE